MNKNDWDVCTNPGHMLKLLRRRGSERKLLLFGVACCRRACHIMTDPCQRDVIESAERFAEGLLTEAEFEAVVERTVNLSSKVPDASQFAWDASHFAIRAIHHLGTAGGAEFAADFA